MAAPPALSDPEIVTRATGWLATLRRPARALEPLSGDVSPRLYFRAHFPDGSSAIVSFYPDAAREAGRRFLATTRLLEDAAVRVPRIEAVALDRGEPGFVLLEDLGRRTVYDLEELAWGDLAPWLDAALDVLPRLRRIEPAAVAALNPPLDAALLRRELEQTWALLFAPHGLVPHGTDAGLERALRASFEGLCLGLAAQPQAVCHRDFMARNLVPLASGELGVLDHQDLRLGPASYDLASLLNDSLYPPAEVEAPRRDRALAACGLGRADYDRAVAQRGLKIAGTFLAFAARGSRRHLRLLRPSVERALEALARLPEGAEVAPAARRWWSSASAKLAT